MSDTVIKVEGLYKKFCTGLRRSMFYGTWDSAKSMFGLAPSDRLRKGEFWALQDINLEIKRGERVGFIGANGSGKTTLLRLLTGIYPPDRGTITIKGRVGALLAVGAGFHPHMTGRENIYLNGTILGMKKREIDKKLEEIVDFAEIEEFIDAPVSTYSSGMRVRLGFSVAAHIEPEILFIDEILAVGDMGFQNKCEKKLIKYEKDGGTFVLVSHNSRAIKNACNKAFLLEKGKVEAQGDVASVFNKYEAATYEKEYQSLSTVGRDQKALSYDSSFQINSTVFRGANGYIKDKFDLGEEFHIEINFSSKREIYKPVINLEIFDIREQIFFKKIERERFEKLEEGETTIRCSIKSINFQVGLYFLVASICEGHMHDRLAVEYKRNFFRIENKSNKYDPESGLVYTPVEWCIRK